MITEDILVFYRDLNERKSQLSSFVQLRNYFKELFLTIKSSKLEIMNKIGQRVDHCFRYDSTQWDLPTEETYEQLISYFNIDKLSF